MKPLQQLCEPDTQSILGDISILHKQISSLPCVEHAPWHIQQNIDLSKNLLLYSHFVDDFVMAAVHYALIALEASLRHALGKPEDAHINAKKMMTEAVEQGLLSDEHDELTKFARAFHEARNGIAHGKEDRMILNHALAIPLVHEVLGIIKALILPPPPIDKK